LNDCFIPVKGDFPLNSELNEDKCENEVHENKKLLEIDEPIKKIDHEEIEVLNKKTNKSLKRKSKDVKDLLDNKIKIVEFPPIINKDLSINKQFIVIMAKYTKNKRNEVIENVIPNSKNYLSIGYDKMNEKFEKTIKKHYRYFVDRELEKTDFLDPDLFTEYDIMRGKRFNSEHGSFWNRFFSIDETYHVIKNF
jgi:hypothetical protein